MMPTYHQLMFPMLKHCANAREHGISIPELLTLLAPYFNLPTEVIEDMLKTTKRAVFYARLGWVKTTLLSAQLIENVPHSQKRIRITERGIDFLNRHPNGFDESHLTEFEEFKKLKTTPTAIDISEQTNRSSDNSSTPEESILDAKEQLHAALALELTNLVLKQTPAFFEKLVVDLVLAMGYGGSREEFGEVVGKSHDGGIDGIIKQDRLGLDSIYIQAKRWKGTVGRQEIQAFVGSLEMHHASKGIFITTSQFSREARDYVGVIGKRVVLVDGEDLANLMIEYKVGATIKEKIEIKKVDLDYFEGE